MVTVVAQWGKKYPAESFGIWDSAKKIKKWHKGKPQRVIHFVRTKVSSQWTWDVTLEATQYKLLTLVVNTVGRDLLANVQMANYLECNFFFFFLRKEDFVFLLLLSGKMLVSEFDSVGIGNKNEMMLHYSGILLLTYLLFE
jgi:hypothetical protein